MRGRTWSVILCADWSKKPGKREVYAASPQARRVWRVDPPTGGWDVAAVIRAAQRIRGGRRPPALVGFDAPIGLPASFLDAAGSRSFVGWLLNRREADAFEPCRDVEQWSVKRPFFGVPKGKGSLAAFEGRMRREGVEPRREIEKRTHAKSVFITSGIPGSVGSSAIDLWRGLIRFRSHVAIWPFDGTLAALRSGRRPVLAEIYPRAAYALAISPDPAPLRAPVGVAKARAEERASFLAQMLGSDSWIHEWAVDLRNLAEAKASEDAFDALVAASGLLRCVLERSPLSDRQLEDACAEGGMLGCGSVRLAGVEAESLVTSGSAPAVNEARARGLAIEPRSWRCPIPGCASVFRESRSGWDSHVAAPGRHPRWHPEVGDPMERKARFKQEYWEFFQS